jgi:RNA polymerase sigma-70 factor (ECF subfamily)
MTGVEARGRAVGSGRGHSSGRARTAVNGAAERDEAFDRWVLPELATMYRVAVAITRDHAEAEDLVQDSLVRAYQALDRFDGANPRAWLLTIVRNTHINRNRRRRPGLLHDPDGIDRQAQTAPGADIEALAAIFDTQVEQALRQLPEDQQAVIELVDVAGLSYQQAADALGVPTGTVMSRLHRGRKRIKRKLSGVALPGIADTGRGDR